MLLGHPHLRLMLRGRNNKLVAEEGGLLCTQMAGQKAGRVAGPRTLSTLEDSLERASSLILLLFSCLDSRNVLAGDQYPRVWGREAGASRGRLHGGRCSSPFPPTPAPANPRPGPVFGGRVSFNMVKGKEVGMGKKKRSG